MGAAETGSVGDTPRAEGTYVSWQPKRFTGESRRRKEHVQLCSGDRVQRRHGAAETGYSGDTVRQGYSTRGIAFEVLLVKGEEGALCGCVIGG